jgi:hypothetical protein
MKTETIVLAGGGVLALILLMKSNSASTSTTPGNTGASSVPPPPSSYDDNYYKTYQYPAMLKQNPNIGNPNYQLTQAEAAQYMNNYLELQQWLPSVMPSIFSNMRDAMQDHWHLYGVAMKYSFMPFTPPKNVNWTHAPENKNSSGSGSGWLGDALSIATTVVGFLGINDNKLNNEEIGVLINGAAIIKQALPFYANVENDPAGAINAKLTSLLEQYT